MKREPAPACIHGISVLRECRQCELESSKNLPRLPEAPLVPGGVSLTSEDFILVECPYCAREFGLLLEAVADAANSQKNDAPSETANDEK